MRPALILLALAACYDPRYADTTLCGTAGACPAGRTCVGDVCLTADAPLTTADDAAATTPDAPTDGATPADAAPETDAGPLVALTIRKAAAGTGTGSITGRGVDCGTGCTEQTFQVELSQALTLQARPAPGSYFRGWENVCSEAPLRRSCDLTPGAPRTVTARFDTVTANLMFITRDGFRGDFGGLATADHHCRTAAEEVGLTGTFVALLAQGDTDLADRLEGAAGTPRGFIRLDGQPVADTVSSLLVDHRIWYPVLFDQDGVARREEVWTGSTVDGQSYPLAQCTGWALPNEEVGAVGFSTGGATMLQGGTLRCSGSASLLCVQNDFQVQVSRPVVTPNPADRYLWISSETFRPPANGLNTPDQLCARSQPAGIATAARALVSTPQAAAYDLLENNYRYVRPDNILVGYGADLRNGVLATGIWVHGDATSSSAQRVWTGSESVNSDGAGDSCGGWVGTSGTGIVGRPDADPVRWWRTDPRASCGTAALPVYCVAE